MKTLNSFFSSERRVVSLIALLALLFASCNAGEEKAFEKPYFDLEGLINKEIAALEAKSPRIKKVVEKDGTREEKELSDIDWEKELSTFLEADINKPAWVNSYKVEKDKGDSSITTYYTTELKDHPIRGLAVETDIQTNECSLVIARRETSNFLYTSTQELGYAPNKGYRIKGSLKVAWLFETNYLVQAEFLEDY